jgi:hypothetical protein
MLDASPLRTFIGGALPRRVAESIRKGRRDGGDRHQPSLGKCFTFIQGQPGHPLDQERRVTPPVQLTRSHPRLRRDPDRLQPVLLRPVGDFYFGDGGLRLVNPFSPAIRLGACVSSRSASLS